MLLRVRGFKGIKIACIDQRDSGELLCMLKFRRFKRIIGGRELKLRERF